MWDLILLVVMGLISLVLLIAHLKMKMYYWASLYLFFVVLYITSIIFSIKENLR